MFLRHQISIAIAFFAVLFLYNPCEAKLFSNAYISFELPTNWDCKLDGTEWVCTSQYAKQAKEAIIILAAKEAGPLDNLAAYKAHLANPKAILDKAGKMVPSKVLHINERKISNHPWVDGMHLGSEVFSYYTRYLGTVKDRLGILVTFSAHKDHYTKYSKDFLKAIESLRVIASKDILESNKPVINVGQNSGVVGAPILDAGDTINELPPEPSAEMPMKTKLALVALLLAVVGVYLIMKRR